MQQPVLLYHPTCVGAQRPSGEKCYTAEDVSSKTAETHRDDMHAALDPVGDAGLKVDATTFAHG